MIKAKIICDSINPIGVRLTTFEITYPRYIHSEIMTHRALSRNAASSRAIPIHKMIKAVINEPAVPEFWGANEKGMQANSELTGLAKKIAQFVWKESRWFGVAIAWTLNKLDVHKQIANRVLEPWSHITVVCTGTYFNNFFSLRAHPMAQPEFQVLAYRMLNSYLNSIPKQLKWKEWHLPYIQNDELSDVLNTKDNPDFSNLSKISAARCARVSYLTHDGKRNVDKDLELYNRLVGQTPLHASALEHVAQAFNIYDYDNPKIVESNFHSSWRQLRKDHPQENITTINLKEVLAKKPDWITL